MDLPSRIEFKILIYDLVFKKHVVNNLKNRKEKKNQQVVRMKMGKSLTICFSLDMRVFNSADCSGRTF